MDDAQEDRRRSPWGAGPLLGQLHFLPSAEAVRENVLVSLELKTELEGYTPITSESLKLPEC